jgi:hypothetical protein
MDPQHRDSDTDDDAPASAAEAAGQAADTGFVWCTTTTPATEEAAAEPGFEWGVAVDAPEESDDRDEDGESDTSGGADGTDTSDRLVLDPALVTTSRGRGIDDEAVTRLAAFRHNSRRSRRERDRERSE